MEVAMVRLMPTSSYSILSESSSVHPGVQVKCRDARILRQKFNILCVQFTNSVQHFLLNRCRFCALFLKRTSQWVYKQFLLHIFRINHKVTTSNENVGNCIGWALEGKSQTKSFTDFNEVFNFFTKLLCAVCGSS